MNYQIVIQSEPDPKDRQFIIDHLVAFNRQQVGDDEHLPLLMTALDDNSQIVAGLVGDTYSGWLYVSILWVAEQARGQGLGSRLLTTAEEEALRRGCHHVHLDTMSFQALPFYQKHAYQTYGVLEDMPVGHQRYFLQKALK